MPVEVKASQSSGGDVRPGERDQALNLVLGQIERNFGKGSIMRLGDASRMRVETISTGALTLDLALGGGYPKGRVVEVYGPESSGKTTLMKLALGLLKPTSGRVLLFGEPAESFSDWHRVGYVPQRTQATESRFPASVREIVNFGSYSGFNPLAIFKRRHGSRVDEAMELAGIEHLADRRVSDLSVGQQQRMLIARSLVRRPDLLVMDEPVAGVDAAGEEQFHSMVRRLNRDLGITIVMVSHDIGAVMREATTCACVNGDIVFHGPVHQLDAQALSGLYGFPVDVLMHDPEHTHR